MPPSFLTAQLSLAMRWGWFQEGRFLGKVLDEWIADSQEFLHTKLPHLVVIVLIAFVPTACCGSSPSIWRAWPSGPEPARDAWPK